MTAARAVAIDLGAGSGRVVDAQYQDGRAEYGEHDEEFHSEGIQ